MHKITLIIYDAVVAWLIVMGLAYALLMILT